MSPSPKVRTSGFFGSLFSLVNCIVGAGVIGVPYALEQSGFIIGIILTVFFAGTLVYTIELVLRTACSSEERGNLPCVSYEALGMLAFGSTGRTVVVVFQFLFAFGGTVAYIKVIEDLAPVALANLSGVSAFQEYDDLVTLALSTFVVLPLFSFRSMAQLDKFSTFSCLVVALVLVIVSYELGANRETLCAATNCTYNYSDPIVRPTLIKTLGVFVFSFTCNHTQFFVYRDYKSRSPDRWARVVRCSLALACCITLSMGVVVFSIFGDAVQGDMFLSFSPSDSSGVDAIDIARLLMTIQICLTFPVVGLVAREMVQILFAMLWRTDACRCCVVRETPGAGAQGQALLLSDSGDLSATESKELLVSTPNPGMTTLSKNQSREASTALHVYTTLGIWGFSILLALLAPDLGDVLNVAGGIAGTGIAFLMPCAFALKLEDEPWGGRRLAWVVMVIGTALGVITTVSTVVFLVIED